MRNVYTEDVLSSRSCNTIYVLIYFCLFKLSEDILKYSIYFFKKYFDKVNFVSTADSQYLKKLFTWTECQYSYKFHIFIGTQVCNSQIHN